MLVANRMYQLTLPDTGAGYYPDLNDSDARIASDQGKPWNQYPVIMYTTGLAGHTDHTLDAGFCPEANTLTACELTPGSNLAVFDLSQAGNLVNPGSQYTVSYHATQANAETDVAPLPLTYPAFHNTVVYARLENVVTGVLVKVETITLKVLPAPVAHVGQIQVCPIVMDGPEGIFTLSDANSQVTGGVAGLTVTYYTSNTEAEAGINPLVSPYTSVTKDIWARVENGACFDLDIVRLVVLSSPGVVLFPEECTTCNGPGQPNGGGGNRIRRAGSIYL